MQGFGFSCFDADIGMPWVASHRISHDACCWMWGGCCTAGLALSALMAVPSGLGLPVLRWSRSRLWRGSGIRWTGIVSPLPVRPCPAPACNTGIGHRRAPGSPNIRRHPTISAGRMGVGSHRYRIRRAHARWHRYRAWLPGTRPISAAAPGPRDCRYRFFSPADIDGQRRGHRYRQGASRALIPVSGAGGQIAWCDIGVTSSTVDIDRRHGASARLSWLPVEVFSLVDFPGDFA